MTFPHVSIPNPIIDLTKSVFIACDQLWKLDRLKPSLMEFIADDGKSQIKQPVTVTYTAEYNFVNSRQI